MVCGIGEYKNKPAKYIRKHLNRSAGSYLKHFTEYTKMGVKDAVVFFCIVGNNGFNKFLFICYCVFLVVW